MCDHLGIYALLGVHIGIVNEDSMVIILCSILAKEKITLLPLELYGFDQVDDLIDLH